jgi:hypothetical protein
MTGASRLQANRRSVAADPCVGLGLAINRVNSGEDRQDSCQHKLWAASAGLDIPATVSQAASA